MDYRPSESRATLATALKNMFFPDQTWGKSSMKIASLICKLVHEAKKCWPHKLDHEAIGEMLSTFRREDLIEAIAMDDTRPMPKTFKSLLELPSPAKVLKEITEKHKECANEGQERL
jgi:hypothetical protein